MVTLKQVKKFHKNKHRISKIVKSKIDKHEVIYGARALNKYLPKSLEEPTNDYDIFTPTPKKDAKQVERALDRKFGGNYFYTKQAIHKGTWRVKDRLRDKEVADYTRPDKTVKYKTINGIKYVTLEWIKKQKKETLRNIEAKYRHAKDKDALNRIKIFQKMKKTKKKPLIINLRQITRFKY